MKFILQDYKILKRKHQLHEALTLTLQLKENKKLLSIEFSIFLPSSPPSSFSIKFFADKFPSKVLRAHKKHPSESGGAPSRWRRGCD